jgi:hypothetical protein
MFRAYVLVSKSRRFEMRIAQTFAYVVSKQHLGTGYCASPEERHCSHSPFRRRC